MQLDQKRQKLLAGSPSCRAAPSRFPPVLIALLWPRQLSWPSGENAVAVTGTSASMAAGELDEANKLAALIGIRHEIVATDEFSQPDYLRNAPDRCYHCKTELYTQLDRLLPQLGVRACVNGANADDLGDYRPGMQAASEHRGAQPAGRMRPHQGGGSRAGAPRGTCPCGTSRRLPASPAASPMARK